MKVFESYNDDESLSSDLEYPKFMIKDMPKKEGKEVRRWSTQGQTKASLNA